MKRSMTSPLVRVVGASLALLLAGCTSGESAQQASTQTGVVEGVVTDPSLAPLPGALVRVDGTPLAATTDASGAFRFALPPGEHLLLATKEGHRGEALRARPEAGGAPVKLGFVLAPLPSQAPSVDVVEAHGLISCAVAVVQGTEATSVNCGSNDPNERKQLAFAMPRTPGLTGIVVELVWTPSTKASTWLNLVLLSGDEPIASSEGTEHISLLLPERVLAETMQAGGDLFVVVEPAGSFTDEEAALDATADLQQPFAVYVSAFYHAPAPAGYSVAKV